MRRVILLLLLFLLNSLATASECRSKMGSCYKPLISGFPLEWAAELNSSAGRLEGSSDGEYSFINNHLFLGLETSLGRNRLLLEPALKFWWKSFNPGVTGRASIKKRLGLRELFYTRELAPGNLTLGLQSMRFANSLLLDERIVGAGLQKPLPWFELNLKSGTGSTRFGRMGRFCANRHLYHLYAGQWPSEQAYVPFETGFVAAAISWQPGYSPPEVVGFETGSEDAGTTEDFGGEFGDEFGDEFSDANFSDLDEFGEFEAEATEASLIERTVNNAGFIFMSEFGSGFAAERYYFGPLLTLKLPAALELQTELLYQLAPEEQLLAYRVQLYRDFFWPNCGMTTFDFNYFGTAPLDERARFRAAFSNLFAGELLRLNTGDMPLVQLGVRYRCHELPLKPMLHLSGLLQLDHEHARELDLHFKLSLYKRMQLHLFYCWVDTRPLETVATLARAELRWTF